MKIKSSIAQNCHKYDCPSMSWAMDTRNCMEKGHQGLNPTKTQLERTGVGRGSPPQSKCSNSLSPTLKIYVQVILYGLERLVINVYTYIDTDTDTCTYKSYTYTYIHTITINLKRDNKFEGEGRGFYVSD